MQARDESPERSARCPTAFHCFHWKSAHHSYIFPKSLGIALIGLFLLVFSAQAGTPTLEGVVKDPTGHPIKGADVRIEAKNFSKIVKTDASGHYLSDGLAVGTYKVTLVVNGSVKASILNATTRAGKPTQLNFDLTTKMAPAKKHTHMVWCPPETGTLIGGGRWIDVDENGNVVNDSSNVQKLNANAAQQMQINVKAGAHPGGQ
jgi:carboxypeptidase family protein